MFRRVFPLDFFIERLGEEKPLLDYVGDVFRWCAVEDNVDFTIGGTVGIFIHLAELIDSFGEPQDQVLTKNGLDRESMVPEFLKLPDYFGECCIRGTRSFHDR